MIKMIRKAKAGLLLSGFAGLMLATGSGSAFAQTCTIDNWKVAGVPASVGLSAANVGRPNQSFAGAPFRRYGGPCGLRVPVDGTPRYLRDGSPANETSYNARFYVFLNSAGNQNIRLFEGVNTSTTPAENALEIWHLPVESKIVLTVETATGPANLEITGIGSGWHSVEFAWASASDATVSLAVNVAIETAAPPEFASATLNTSGQSIGEARLGNVNGASATNAFIDFDDFDSRRVSTPGRLCRGLTDESRDALSGDDAIEIYRESFGLAVAAGQPDYNEDGAVTGDDAIDLYRTVFGIAGGAPSPDCADNS